MSKKLLAAGVVLTLVAAVLVGVGATTASAQSMSLCQTVDALVLAGVIAPDKVAAAKAAAGCGATAPASCAASFTRNLTVGSTGADVTALQTKLGVTPATGYFGAITKAAVVAYQTANGIAPAAGYVGPITLAKLNYCAPVVVPPTTTPGTPVVTGGDEGQLIDIDNTSADVESNLTEGEEDVNVLGVEVTAEDSDISINRVDVDFAVSAGSPASDNLDDYITEVTLMNGSKKVATLDVDDANVDDGSTGDDLTGTNDVYSFRFSGLNIVVEQDETVELYVAVSAVNSVDSDDADKDLVVIIPVDGIRAVDGAGISETYVSGTEVTEETFSVDTAEAGNIDLTIDESDNLDTVIAVDADADTLGEPILTFVLEGDASTNLVDSIEIDLATTTATTTLVADAVKRLKLYADGTLVGTENISGVANAEKVVFDNLDIEIAEDEEVEFVVKADFNDEADTREGFAFAATVDASEIDVEDAEGDDVTVTGDVTGGEMELRTQGIIVNLSGTPSVTKTMTADATGEKDQANYKIVFTVKANGDDMWIDKSVQNSDAPASAGLGVAWATTAESTGTTATQTSSLSASGSTSGDSTTGYKIVKGATRTFTLQVTLEADTDGSTAVMLTGINYDTDSNTANSTSYYTFNLDDYKTDLMFLNAF